MSKEDLRKNGGDPNPRAIHLIEIYHPKRKHWYIAKKTKMENLR